MGYYTNLITSMGLTEARLRALKDAGLRHIQLGFNPPTMTWHASWPESMCWSASSAWHS